MNTLFALLYVASFSCIFLSLVNPNLFKRFFKEKTSRKYNLKIFGIIFLISFILTGMTTETKEKLREDQFEEKTKNEEKSKKVELKQNQEVPLENESVDFARENKDNQENDDDESDVGVNLKEEIITQEKSEEDVVDKNIVDEERENDILSEEIIENTTIKNIEITTKKVIEEDDANIETENTEKYVCNCSKTCPNLDFVEAQYQLKVCGCKVRDRDKDGIACEKD